MPLVNNAVVYEDDIALTPGPSFNINGRIITNSNFITGGGAGIRLYQVSSQDSCFYEEENGKIIVGGNLGAGGFTADKDAGTSTVADLFKRKPDKNTFAAITSINIKDNKSANAAPRDIAYNTLAYTQRINHLVNAQMQKPENTDPKAEVTDAIPREAEKENKTVATLSTDEKTRIRRKLLDRYFRKRTRRVPYVEVAFGGDALVGKDTVSEFKTNPLRWKW
ncbi:MAG: hypothetical protein HC908_11910 [Calothrix sp. SM1_7_51]|nr:hypothetical protein [Calothrix sp. SM1_7_51]